MKNISITQLETARRNTINFAKSLKDGSSAINSFGGRPKSMKWFEAIMVYHSTSDISMAISALEHSFSNRKNTSFNRRELEKLILSIDNYVSEYNKLQYIFIDKKVNLSIPISKSLKISGWIWIINMKPDGGYAGYIISKNINELKWDLELRFPIIQNYMASSIYGCDSKLIDVGVIDFMSGKHYLKSYSNNEISDAISELELIKTTIKRILS